MTDTIFAIKENWNWFWGTGHYEILFLISLLYIFIMEKDIRNKQMLFWYSVIILFIILNPLFASGVKIFFSIESGVYVRLFLLMPIHIVIAYAMLKLLEHVKPFSEKIKLFVGFLVLLLLSGTTYYQEGLFLQADNLMKIPNETIEVCNILESDSDAVKVIAPAELLPYIRQYDANILLCYGRNGSSNDSERTQSLYAQFESSEIDVGNIVSELRELECHYIVYYKNDAIVNRFIDNGYFFIGETENYVILKEGGEENEYT